MAGLACFDWPRYLSGLADGEARALATWLAAEGLDLGEFMDVVDRAYATAPARWRARPRPFLARLGRPAVEAYARRKRRFAHLLATLEEALVAGALPGEVAPEELRLPVSPHTEHRRAADHLAALERARRALGPP
jgi:hypothetical protein